ncbi:hypothetical protein GY45DRAFT_944880 [Cubamyces sp. BRFM 1775]|nr:hypothetical protein GY45DRAFT_944880 [Cubamyces sp. BRFM 1775]
MSGTSTDALPEAESRANVPAAESDTSRPHNRLAAKHTDCPCNIDPRCQLAVAFQGAREYWASHPDDVANRPNEIHESIEKWLVAKRILEGPPQIAPKDETGDPGDPPEPISPSRSSGTWLPRLRFRRLSLPHRASSTAKSFTMSPTAKLRRRHTDSESGADDPSSSSGSMSVLPTSPTKKLFRNVALILAPGRHKRMARRRAYSEASSSSAYESLSSSRSSGVGAQLDVTEVLNTISASAGSIYEDAMECRAAPTLATQSDAKLCPVTRVSTSSTSHEQDQAGAPLDPAYAALMPILYELEAMHDHPRCKAVAAEHNDEDYMQFWETFSQLSAKDILSAVYAIRAGVLDAPIPCDGGAASTGAVVLCAFWGFSASVIALYLYFV